LPHRAWRKWRREQHQRPASVGGAGRRAVARLCPGGDGPATSRPHSGAMRLRPLLIRRGPGLTLLVLASSALLAALGPGWTRASAASRHERPAPAGPAPPPTPT